MSLITELVKYSNKAYQKEFVSATDGNLSVRLDENRIAITKSGICKGDVTEKDIVIVNNLGNKIEGEGKASSELKIHLLVYNNRPDVNAVIHCHPVYSTAIATSNSDLTDPIFPEVILGIGPVPLCEYGTPSTEELPNSMKPYIQNSWAMLLQNHGAVAFGSDIASAYNRMEKLEHASKTIIISKILGGPTILSKNNVDKLYSIAESTYGVKPIGMYSLPNEANNGNPKNFTKIIEARLRARAGNPNQAFINKINRNTFSEGTNDSIKKIIND